MISEACSTGKPVNIFPLGKNSEKREKFISSLEKMGLVKHFNGEYQSWHYEPLNETARIAELIKIKLKEKRIMRAAVGAEPNQCP
jgi:mitochondrial fission protein ELM1